MPPGITEWFYGLYGTVLHKTNLIGRGQMRRAHATENKTAKHH